MAMAMSEKEEPLKNSVVEVIFVDIENFSKDFAHTKDSLFDNFNIQKQELSINPNMSDLTLSKLP